MSKRFKESSERSDESTGTRSLLSRLSGRELKNIKVVIRSHDAPGTSSPVPLQKNLGDPKDLVIHRRGEGQRPIFDRKDIVVNVEKHLEERIVLNSPVPTTSEEGSSKRSRSKSYSDRERSVESYRSGSSRNRRSSSRSPSAGSRKSVKRKPGYSKDYGRKGSPSSRGRQTSENRREVYRDKNRAEASVKKSNRSVSPSYKRSESDRYGSRSRTFPKEKYYRERSPKAGTSRNARERERSSKDRRDTEGYRKTPYKGSPRTADHRDGTPKRYDRNRSRSRSRKLNYKYIGGDKEKYPRPRTPPSGHSKRYSMSPHSRRRSRSPYSRKHSQSPHSKRRSRSPHFKRTPQREESGFRGSSASGSKTRKRSGSPYEREKKYLTSIAAHGRPTYSKRHSRSPYSRKHSRSPHRTELVHKYRKRSRSPYRRDSESHHRARSRSPSVKAQKHSKHDERNHHKSPSGDQNEYGGLPPNFDYYGTEGFWIPGPIPRPGFMPRGIMPSPMTMARGIIRPPPSYVFPRPYIPMPPHPLHQFRPRFPIAYNQPYRPRKLAPSPAVISKSATVTTSTVAKPTSTSTVSVPSTSTSTSSNPIIEEPTSDTENVESTVEDKA